MGEAKKIKTLQKQGKGQKMYKASYENIIVAFSGGWIVGEKKTFFVNGKAVTRRIYDDKDDMYIIVKNTRFNFMDFE